MGLLTVKTGPVAQGGIQMEQGIVTFLKEKNYSLAGHKIDFISADTGGNPAGAKNKVLELIDRDHVDVILGPLAAAKLLAITDYVRQKETPLISLAAADDVTQRHVNPFVVRPSASSSQCTQVLGDYAAKDLKYKTATTLASDFAFGYEQVGGFQRVFEDGGGQVVAKLWPPLVIPDYTPYIAQIQNVGCCMNGLEGSNPVKFLRSYQGLGLKAKTPLLAGWTAMDDALLHSVSDDAIGVVSAAWYSAEFDTPSNKRFVADMKKDFGGLPGGYSAGMYIAGQCLEAALQKAGGKPESGKQLADLLHSVSDRHAAGRISFRPVRKRRRERVHPQVRAQERAASQHGGQDVSERQPVLDLRRKMVPRAARLFARLSAAEACLVVRPSHGWTRPPLDHPGSEQHRLWRPAVPALRRLCALFRADANSQSDARLLPGCRARVWESPS